MYVTSSNKYGLKHSEYDLIRISKRNSHWLNIKDIHKGLTVVVHFHTLH